jgi:hypothetical protein
MVIAFALPAAAQTVTTNDIQRLQDQVYQASADVSRLRASNPDLASRLQGELDDVRDEVVYLRVKLRKEGSVNQAVYSEVRDRLQDIRSRANGESQSSNQEWRTNSAANGGASSSRPGGSGTGVTGGVYGSTADDRAQIEQDTSQRAPRRGNGTSAIPSGQEIDVRLQSELSSETAQVEQRFEATTLADLYRGNEVLIPAGSVVRGIISSVNKATRTDRRGSMTVSFDQITVRGRDYPMRGTVTQAIESSGIKGEAGKIGAGAGVGAIIGGIIGGVKGALLGVLIGGGGTVAATEGKDVTLPQGTILRVRLDTPPNIR